MILVCFLLSDVQVLAKSKSDTILDGVYIGHIDLSGMSMEEARDKMQSFVDDMSQRVVTFGTANEGYVAVTAGNLGARWTNQEVLEEAISLGKDGNIVQRYKAIEDLKHGNKVYPLELEFDKEMIRNILEEQCTEYDISAVNPKLKRENGEFTVIEGRTGLAVDVECSLDKIYNCLKTDWKYDDICIDLDVKVTNPTGNPEDLLAVKDVLGTYTTSFSTSGTSRCKNIENGCRLIDGTTLFPGEEFSTLAAITPFTENNGYYLAGSYLNGKVVESLGGGICQVSTTLYNAILLSEIEVTSRSNHSMIISYVEPSMDAAIAESSGKDFRFRNNLEHPIYIEGYIQNKKITFVVYGAEYRNPTRKVTYQSEVLETEYPDHDNIVTDSSQPIGYINIESAHIGYKARLWKIVEENNQEISREIINKSTYKLSPRTVTVGINHSNPVYVARMKNAIATKSVDIIRAEMANIQAEINMLSQMIHQPE